MMTAPVERGQINLNAPGFVMIADKNTKKNVLEIKLDLQLVLL